MNLRRQVEKLDLVVVLLVVAALELALNRLAVPVLRPAGIRPPPVWHRELDRVGLFCFHLTAILALGVAALESWELTIARRTFPAWAAALVGAGAMAFLGLGAWGVLVSVPPTLSFHLESSFTLLLLLVGLAIATRPGDMRVKVGYLIITVPMLFHYYGTFALKLLMNGEAARGSSLPDRIRDAGQYSVALAAIGVAFCFAPRPLLRTLLRPAPIVIAGFVGTLVAVVMIRHEDVGMEIASKGLGIELMPGIPVPLLAAFVLAATAVAWTLTVTLGSDSPARRRLGAGYGLVVVGGYAFAWPGQLLTVIAGALAIADASLRVDQVESESSDEEPLLRTPSIPEGTWRAWVDALGRKLESQDVKVVGTARVEVTRIVGRRGELPFEVAISRVPGGVLSVDLVFGDPPELAEPDFVLSARSDRLLGKAAHPAPPETTAPSVRTGDEAFDERFRVHARPGLTERLFDDLARARASAVLDGWVAAWNGRGLRYRVCPGRGAPLDHPIPITELAFRGGDPSAATERLVRVFELLAEIAGRVRPA